MKIRKCDSILPYPYHKEVDSMIYTYHDYISNWLPSSKLINQPLNVILHHAINNNIHTYFCRFLYQILCEKNHQLMFHLAFILWIIHDAASDRIDDEQQLQSYLFGRFKKDVIPITKIGMPVYVNFKASLARIIQVVSIFIPSTALPMFGEPQWTN